ncbi:histidine phosphatase family protein [Mycobacterium sp. KBS0706]|uniref:histidine phosphatase family protein n=1 Tax=Mycobacterium sp. KBS0706 TaxID=2578109 RepID=UPI00110F9663|nr:histidine phosphatase family protein [Mycobacterium sp. KBS0706]TSD88535.1 histidine phosphatase family protein [Mycobacterium sp. KBS0706]
MQPFLFLRHGQSTANRDRVIAGSTDAALTGLGEAQAREAAVALAGSGIRRIVASPQRRALRTAEIVAEALGLPVATDPGLVERHWGTWEGRLVADRPDYFMVPEGGESWEAFRDRAWAACEPILAAGPAPLAGPLLIVAHAGIMRVLRDRLGLGFEARGVGNALPMRFTPPDSAGLPWRLAPVMKLQPEPASTPGIV